MIYEGTNQIQALDLLQRKVCCPALDGLAPLLEVFAAEAALPSAHAASLQSWCDTLAKLPMPWPRTLPRCRTARPCCGGLPAAGRHRGPGLHLVPCCPCGPALDPAHPCSRPEARRCSLLFRSVAASRAAHALRLVQAARTPSRRCKRLFTILGAAFLLKQKETKMTSISPKAVRKRRHRPLPSMALLVAGAANSPEQCAGLWHGRCGGGIPDPGWRQWLADADADGSLRHHALAAGISRHGRLGQWAKAGFVLEMGMALDTWRIAASGRGFGRQAHVGLSGQWAR